MRILRLTGAQRRNTHSLHGWNNILNRYTAKGVQSGLDNHEQEAKATEDDTYPSDKRVGKNPVILCEKGYLDQIESDIVEVYHDEEGQIEAV